MLLTQIRRFIGILGLACLVWFVRGWLGYNPNAFAGVVDGLTVNLGDNWATAGVAILTIGAILFGWLDRRRWTTLIGYIGLMVASASGIFVLSNLKIEGGLVFRAVGILVLAVTLFGMAFVPSNPEREHVEVNGWMPQAANFRLPGFARRVGSGIMGGGRATGRWFGRRWQNHRNNAARRAEDREFDRLERQARLEELRRAATSEPDDSNTPAASAPGTPNA